MHHVASESKRSKVILSSESNNELQEQQESVAEDDSEDQIMLDAMLREIRKLPIKQRQVITLHLEGLQYDEISDVCGMSTSNVGVMINCVRKHLSELLQGGQS